MDELLDVMKQMLNKMDGIAINLESMNKRVEKLEEDTLCMTKTVSNLNQSIQTFMTSQESDESYTMKDLYDQLEKINELIETSNGHFDDICRNTDNLNELDRINEENQNKFISLYDKLSEIDSTLSSVDYNTMDLSEIRDKNNEMNDKLDVLDDMSSTMYDTNSILSEIAENTSTENCFDKTKNRFDQSKESSLEKNICSKMEDMTSDLISKIEAINRYNSISDLYEKLKDIEEELRWIQAEMD